MFGFLKKMFTGADKTAGAASDRPHNGYPRPSGPWFGVDLDGTLAVWESTTSMNHIGPPVPAMVDYVKRMVASGIRVKIFTARACDPDQIPIIRAWLRKNGLPDLEITNVKDYNMERLYDDRAVRVERNTGRII